MDRCKRLMIIAAVLVLSTSALADSILDPGGIIRRGSYTEPAIIGPGPTITFNGASVSSFNPFTAGFCDQDGEGSVPGMEGSQSGPACLYENHSGQTIDSFELQFSASAADFIAAGGLFCFNEISGGESETFNCATPGGNALLFSALGIPTDPPSDPFAFNVFFFGFNENHDLANIASSSVNGALVPVPEPASISLLLTGLSAMGLRLKRKNCRKS
jgi:hypothetical protein